MVLLHQVDNYSPRDEAVLLKWIGTCHADPLLTLAIAVGPGSTVPRLRGRVE
jgi:hypothetical protein